MREIFIAGKDYEHLIGQRFTLKPSITSRPDYFNETGHMDKYLNGMSFKAVDVTMASFGAAIRIKDGYDDWYISVHDVVPLELDNRKVRSHG